MAAYELFYIVDAVNVDIISYVADFKLEKELDKLLDKISLKISRSIDNLGGFSGFDPNVELFLKFNSIGIFRGRIKTADKKEYYIVEAYSSAEILNRSIAQEVYENTTPEEIFTNLINIYSDLTPVAETSGITINRFVADEYVSSIITKLSDALGWSIYTDSSKNIYFRPRGNVTNATVIRRQSNNSNARFGEWKKDHNEMCNDLRITGDNVNYNSQETFTGDGSGREFTLIEQPVSIKITIDNIEQSLGSYSINAELRKILFNTAPGDSSSIVVDYEYARPTYVVREDGTSISTYGRFTKILFHKWIKSRSDAIVYANNFITAYKNPLLSNNIIMNAAYITSFAVGEQVQIIDDLEGYNDYYTINKIKLGYLTGTIELNVGSYVPVYINLQSSIQDRVKELERNLSESTLQRYISQSETLEATETLTEGNDNYLNFKIASYSNLPKCDFGRGTLNDARVGLCYARDIILSQLYQAYMTDLLYKSLNINSNYKFDTLLKTLNNYSNYNLDVHLFSGTWSNSGNLNTARRDLAAFGTQSAGVSCGGYTGADSAVTELFNGSTWANSGNLNTARRRLAAFGIQSAGVCCGGYTGAYSAVTELFNGSTWSNSGNLNTARDRFPGFGTQSAGVCCGGYTGAYSAVTELFNGSTWAYSGNLNTARNGLGGFGTQSAGVSCGGYTGGNSAVTELFNGSTWANSGNLNTARRRLAAFGIQSAGVCCGGYTGAYSAVTELFNGSTWSNSGNLNIARYDLAAFGTQLAGVSCGGYTDTYSAVTELFT